MFLILKYPYFICAVILARKRNLGTYGDTGLPTHSTMQRGRGLLGIRVSVNGTLDGIDVEICTRSPGKHEMYIPHLVFTLRPMLARHFPHTSMRALLYILLPHFSS